MEEHCLGRWVGVRYSLDENSLGWSRLQVGVGYSLDEQTPGGWVRIDCSLDEYEAISVPRIPIMPWE